MTTRCPSDRFFQWRYRLSLTTVIARHVIWHTLPSLVSTTITSKVLRWRTITGSNTTIPEIQLDPMFLGSLEVWTARRTVPWSLPCMLAIRRRSCVSWWSDTSVWSSTWSQLSCDSLTSWDISGSCVRTTSSDLSRGLVREISRRRQADLNHRKNLIWQLVSNRRSGTR